MLNIKALTAEERREIQKAKKLEYMRQYAANKRKGNVNYERGPYNVRSRAKNEANLSPELSKKWPFLSKKNA